MGRKKTGDESNGAATSEAPKTRAPRVKKSTSDTLKELHASKLKEVDKLSKQLMQKRDEVDTLNRAFRDADRELDQLAKAAGIERERDQAAEASA